MIPGMNKKQMKQMERQMKKMGMKMEDLEGVKEVIIRFEDKELIIDNNENISYELLAFTIPTSNSSLNFSISSEKVAVKTPLLQWTSLLEILQAENHSYITIRAKRNSSSAMTLHETLTEVCCQSFRLLTTKRLVIN